MKILVINCMSVSTGPRHAEAILLNGLQRKPDIVLGVECADFRAAHPDYYFFQPGRLGSAESGTLVGVRNETVSLNRRKLILGSAETAEGGGIRDRWITLGVVTHNKRRFRVASGHAPPDRSPRARARFMRRFAAVRAKFKGGDLNLPQRLAARALGSRLVGEGVLWLTIPITWKIIRVKHINVGGDHLAILAEVKRKR